MGRLRHARELRRIAQALQLVPSRLDWRADSRERAVAVSTAVSSGGLPRATWHALRLNPVMKPGLFGRFARGTARSVGHPATFTGALAVVLTWAVTGPWFRYSDTWQLVINTGTTVVRIPPIAITCFGASRSRVPRHGDHAYRRIAIGAKRRLSWGLV